LWAWPYYVAQQIGVVPAELFDEIASCLPGGPLPALLRGFATRDDITLEAFAWQLADTSGRPDFVSPSDELRRARRQTVTSMASRPGPTPRTRGGKIHPVRGVAWL